MINKYQGRLEEGGEFVEFLIQDLKVDDYHSSMYLIYFLIRRFLTAGILIFANRSPYFQCTFLMLSSTINFIYLSSSRPLSTRKENAIELFNELCILLCSHLFDVFLMQ